MAPRIGDISNPVGGTPPEGKRFSATNQPASQGRTPTAWLRAKLAKSLKDRDVSAREAIADHLIEVATSWQVVIKGHGENAIEVASAKDSIEAAKVLYAYDMGKPVESIELNSVNAPKVLIYLPSNGREPPKPPPPVEAPDQGDEAPADG
jgi:hypothetical protein